MNAWRHEWKINVKDTLPCVEFCKIDLERTDLFFIKKKLNMIDLELLNVVDINEHLIIDV